MPMEGKTSQHKRGSVATYWGVEFFPLAPRQEDVFVEDVAHSASQICRYGGHSMAHYSVAQHSVLVSEYAEALSSTHWGVEGETDPLVAARWGLIHDAGECYTADICAPIKPYLSLLNLIEDRCLAAVAARCGLEWPMPEVIHYADTAVFRAEVRSGIMRNCPWWKFPDDCPDSGDVVQFMSPPEAKELWLDRFVELFGVELYQEIARPR